MTNTTDKLALTFSRVFGISFTKACNNLESAERGDLGLDIKEKISQIIIAHGSGMTAVALYLYNHREVLPDTIMTFKGYGESLSCDLEPMFVKDLKPRDYKHLKYLEENYQGGLICIGLEWDELISKTNDERKEKKEKEVDPKYYSDINSYSCGAIFNNCCGINLVDYINRHMRNFPPSRVISTIAFQKRKVKSSVINKPANKTLKFMCSGYSGPRYMTLFSKFSSYMDDKTYQGSILDDILEQNSKNPRVLAAKQLVSSNSHNLLKSLKETPSNGLYRAPLMTLITNHIKNSCDGQIELEERFKYTLKAQEPGGDEREVEYEFPPERGNTINYDDFYYSQDWCVFYSFCDKPESSMMQQGRRYTAFHFFNKIFNGNNKHPWKRKCDGLIKAPDLLLQMY
ncbi:MAG: hypothetical protein RPS47_10290 [Colwellia sp.]